MHGPRPTRSIARRAMSVAPRWGLGLVSVTLAFILAQTFVSNHLPQPFTAFALSAIAVTFWYSGTTAGIFTTLIAWLALDYFFDPAVSAEARILYGLVFLVFALVMILVMRGRNELEAKVAERTAELTKTNEDLTREIARQDELRAVIDNAPVFLWSDLPDGYCDFLNQRWLTYFNLSMQEAQGAGWTTLLHPDDAAHHLENWRKSISTGVPFETEARYRGPDGEYRWFLNRANPLRDKTGRIVKWYGTNFDIENLKRTETKLRLSEAYLAESQRLSHTGTWAFNATTTLYWSEESYRIWGLDPLQGPPDRETVWQWVHPDDRDRAREEIAETFRQKRDYAGEFRILLPDGTVKHLQVTGHHVFSESGDIVEVISTQVDVTNRKRAEEALRENEYKLRQITDTVPGLIWSTGPDGETTHVNQRLLDYSGMRFEAFKHRGWEALVHPNDLPETVKAYDHAIQTGTSFQGVLRLRRADGAFRWHHARSEPLRDQQGRIIQWYGVTIDIDEVKKAEEQPRSAAQLQATLNVLPTYTWYAAPSGALTFVNKRTAEYLGIPEDHPLRFGIDIGAHWEDWLPLLHPDDREEARQYWSNCLRTGEAAEHTYRVRDAQGDYRWFLSRVEPLRASDGTLLQWVGATLDIEELKRTEQALRESEAKFRDYAETASDWFWEIGPDLKFTLLTGNAFGSDPADRIGTMCWDHALDLESEPEKWRLVQEALDSRKPFRDFVYCSADGAGLPMYVKASGMPVFDASGEFRGYRGTGTDVTATKRAERAETSLRTVQADLAHVSRVTTLGQLTASIAHEITQPIATARNNARAAVNFLDRPSPDLDEVREALDCIVADADRAGEIIDRIRDHIKKAPPRSDPFDLNKAINEVIMLTGGEITKHGVSVQTRLAEGLFPVGDRVQLQQVVMNLILNAIEAMEAVEAGARALSISTEESQEGVLVAVRDAGLGIGPEHIERIFEAFYTTKSRGVGMGLSICRSIIDAHGGRLWADANESRGAVFQFTLPSVKKDLMNSHQSAHQTGGPHEDTALDGSHQSASGDSRQRPRSGRGRRHWDRQ